LKQADLSGHRRRRRLADVTINGRHWGRRVGRDDGTTVTVSSVRPTDDRRLPPRHRSGQSDVNYILRQLHRQPGDESPERAENRYYHRNPTVDSVVATTNGSEPFKERYAYSDIPNTFDHQRRGTARTTIARGNRTRTQVREFGRSVDLYHYRARMYDSGWQVCSKDPIGV